jgi:hypothetical protein
MKKKILSVLLIGVIIIGITGCGNSNKSEAEVDDESALHTIRNAINEVYNHDEKLTTNNVQKYMVGNWTIVEAPENTIRQSIPTKLDPTTADDEWDTMFITACNSKTGICKDLRIFRNDEGKLYVGSEAGAYPQQ